MKRSGVVTVSLRGVNKEFGLTTSDQGKTPIFLGVIF